MAKQSTVCVLSIHEAEEFKVSGYVSPCRHHRHMSKKKADEFTSALRFWDGKARHYDAYYLGKGKKLMYFAEAREFKPTMSMGGIAVYQLVGIGC